MSAANPSESIQTLFQEGFKYQQAGNLNQAMALYQNILSLNPQHISTLINLGVAYLDRQDPRQSETCFRQVLLHAPKHLDALNNLGNALKNQNRLSEALACYAQALEVDATCPDIWDNQGIVLYQLNRLDEAQSCFEQAIQLDKCFIKAWLNLGSVLEEKEAFQEASGCYQYVIQKDPSNPHAYRRLAHLVYRHGEFDAAVKGYQAAYVLAPFQKAWHLQAETLCPIIPQSEAQILEVHQRIQDCLDALAQKSISLSVDTLEDSDLEPSFYLSYQGLDDLAIKSAYADILARNLPPIPQLPPLKKTLNKAKPKVGFLVTPRHEGIFARLLANVAGLLSPEKVDSRIICRDSAREVIQYEVQQTEGCEFQPLRFVTLSNHLQTALNDIRQEAFDIVVFFEVGSDSLNYFLALYRLAPIQCATWGSPVTTGLPTMDYFLSSKILETSEAQSHYREKLVLLPSLPTYYPRPILPSSDLPSNNIGLIQTQIDKPIEKLNLQDFGISKESHVYCCLQNLFKLHPSMDAIFAQILERDPLGELFFLAGAQPRWTQLFYERLQKHLPPGAESRVHFLPKMPREEFMAFQSLSHVMLDPIGFGGGNTTLEGLAFGTPIITLPSEFMKGRITAACYQKMGISGCIVSTPEEYVEQALALGNDPEENQRIRTLILERCSVLYEDSTFITALEEFFQQAVSDSSCL